MQLQSSEYLLHFYETSHIFYKNASNYRYLDDLLQVRCNGYTYGVNLDFYPGTLQLKRSSNNPVNVDFLNLNLEIRNNSLVTKIYNKRDNYDFETIKILRFSSNVHISVFRKIF